MTPRLRSTWKIAAQSASVGLRRTEPSAEEGVAWIRAGRFTEYVSELARGFAEAEAPMVWAALLRSAEDGNVPAARLYFDLMERGRRGDPMSLPASLPAAPSEELKALRDSIFGGA